MTDMNNNSLGKTIEGIYSEGLDLIKRKNSDYAMAGSPFLSFEQSAMIAGISVEQGFLVRIGDKITRIKNLLTKPASITTEQLEDTMMDLVNYSALLLAYRKLKVDKK